MQDTRLNAKELRLSCAGQVIGRRLVLYDEVSSTNEAALACGDDRENHGLLILAEHQSHGRGRLNRAWHSPRGASILCTLLLFLEQDSAPATSALLWPALAARQAISDATQISPVIKWPNDLLINRRKVSGILIESRQLRGSDLRAYAIGIGINCLQHTRHFPPELAETATSLDLCSAEPVDRRQVAGALIRALEEWYVYATIQDVSELAAVWLQHAVTPGGRITLRSEGRRFCGCVVEIDPLAGIVVELDCGSRQIFSPQTTTILTIE